MINPKSFSCYVKSNIEEDEIQIIPAKKKITKKSSKRGQIILIFIFLVLIIGGGGKWWLVSNNKKNNAVTEATKEQQKASPVKLQTLKSELLEDSTTVIGTLDATRAVTIKSEVDGRIKQILVKEGTRVSTGQIILKLESDELRAELFQTKAQLENAQARLTQLKTGSRQEDIASAKAQLDQAKAKLNNAKIGTSPELIAQAQAQIESAQADLDLAQERLKRYSELQKEGAISQDQFDERLKTQRQAIASLTEAQRRLTALTKGRQADLNELQAGVEEARQNLKRLENGPRIEEIAQAKAEVSQAIAAMKMIDVKIKKTEIIAPFEGIIGNIPVKLGDYVDSGDELTTVTENNLLEVNLYIPLEQAGKLRLGLPVIILDAQGKTLTSGEISFISPDATANTQLVLAKANIPNFSGLLFNKGSIQAKIIWDKHPGILVPSSAVSRLGDKTFVFVAENKKNTSSDKPELIAKQKLVTLGGIQGNNYQVLEGLKVGEQIITAGILNLRDESPVSLIVSDKLPIEKK